MMVQSWLYPQYRNTPEYEIPSLPVSALVGVSPADEKSLQNAFNVKTIEDLASLKYIEWAEELLNLAIGSDPDPDLSGFRDKLIKKYETKHINEVIEAPPSALQGVSASDAALLKKSFAIETVRDLAYFRPARHARDLLGIKTAPATTPAPHVDDPGVVRRMKIFVAFLVLIALFTVSFPYLKELKFSSPNNATSMQTTNEKTKPEEITENAEESEDVAEKIEAPSTEPEKEKTKEPPQKVVQEDEGRIYVVKRGESLNLISKKLYGSYGKWKKLYRLNKNKIRNPHHLYPGLKLRY